MAKKFTLVLATLAALVGLAAPANADTPKHETCIATPTTTCPSGDSNFWP